MKLKTLLFSSVMLITGGCASIEQPSSAEFAALPLIPFGSSVPADGEYILHLPQGIAIDTPVTFGGNLFMADDLKTLTVTPRHDIYVYKDWVSYDRKTWQLGADAMQADLQLKLPGYDHPKTGYLNLRLDRKSF